MRPSTFSTRNSARLARVLLGTTILAADVLATTASQADTINDLIDRLKAKGVITTAEFQRLKKRRAADLRTHKHVDVDRFLDSTADLTAASDDRYVKAVGKGVGIRMGDVDVSLSGGLQFFDVEQFKGEVAGSARAGGVVGGQINVDTSTAVDSNAIRGGLLGSYAVLSIATHQSGYDLGLTFGAYTYGNNVDVGATPLNANSYGIANALGTPSIDLRQVFGTIGTPEAGTVTIGRNIGFFGSDILLNDAMLFGMGLPFRNGEPAVGINHIGSGYLYADWIPQISYTSPVFHGFTASVGVFTPLSQPAIFTGADSGNLSGHDQPMFQGRIKYTGDLSRNINLTAWTSGITQEQKSEGFAAGDALPTGGTVRDSGIDAGAKVNLWDASLVGYGYYGNGIGDSGLFFDGLSPNGEQRRSYGWMGQATYTFFGKLTVGGNYGVSYLKANAFDATQSYDTYLIKSQDSYVAFARYQLTSWMLLEANFFRGTAYNQSGGSFSSDAFAVGTMLQF